MWRCHATVSKRSPHTLPIKVPCIFNIVISTRTLVLFVFFGDQSHSPVLSFLSTGRPSFYQPSQGESVCEKTKHCKNSLGISDQTSNCWDTLGSFEWSFLWMLTVLIIHEFLTAGHLVFWTIVPVSRGLYGMPKLREFVHNKSRTLFRIASHFWTNISSLTGHS